MGNKVINHLKTVYEHRKEVRRLCFKVGLYKQGLLHDLSKYSPVEFLSSVKYYTGTCSPIDMEIKEIGYSECWLHHKGRNKHHAEYWVDQAHKIICDIPFEYIAEMFCDMVAASKVYLKEKYTDASAYNYAKERVEIYEKYMSKNTLSTLLFLLLSLKDKGEKNTLSMIKWRINNG